MSVRPLDTLLAVKVISMIDDLRPSDRRIGTTLIEHYNRRTGRCDPSVGRLAVLCGYSTRTVHRATRSLEARGLFKKWRHGGFANRNQYEPNWEKLTELVSEVNGKLWSRARVRRTAMSPGDSRPCHLEGDAHVTQTYKDNQHKNEHCSSDRPDVPLPRLPRLLEAAFKKPTVSSSTARRSAAERRISDALLHLYAKTPDTLAGVIDRIDVRMMDAAVESELRRRGSGIHSLLESLKAQVTP